MAEAQERIGPEPLSRVMFDIEPLGELVKLTVVHDGFEPGSLVAKLVTQAGRRPRRLEDAARDWRDLPESSEPLPPVRLGLTNVLEGDR